LAIVIRSLKYHFESREEDNFFKPVAKSAGDDSGNNERARIARVPGIMLIIWPIVPYDQSREQDHRRYHTQVTLLTILQQD
jgi:hypothetical protein